MVVVTLIEAKNVFMNTDTAALYVAVVTFSRGDFC